MTEREIFTAALAKGNPAERAAYLDEACRGDAPLRQRVESLLADHAQLGSFMDVPSPEATLDSTPSERPGTQIGPYKLLQQIGEGGMGVVYMAEQTEPVKRRVAVKIIKPGMDTRQVIARFEAERQALSLMDHPNIAKVLDAGEVGQVSNLPLEVGQVCNLPSPDRQVENLPHFGRPYFVMELVKGQPITQYCDEHHLTPRQRLELLLPVCQAIQHAHQKGIIHRDIKPTNILVAEYDNQPVPKVIDFGVAKAISQSLTEKTMFTGLGQIVGTLEYMSPEQAKVNQLDIDTRSDIYSLGVLLYELLAGSPPFEQSRFRTLAFDETLRIIREEEPQRPSTKLSSSETLATIAANRNIEPAKLTRLVRGELDWIVMKTLEKDRARRYETASALAADVQRYLHDEPVQACPPSAWYRFRKFARRYKRAVQTAAVVALAVLLTAASSGVLIWRAVTSERRGAYLERIALTEREWGADNLSRMEELLDECPKDLRGWEWHYLKRLRYGATSPLRYGSAVESVAFSPDGKYLATATKDGFVRLLQAKNRQELQKWQAHDENASSLRFSPNSQYLASGGWDAKVKVWDVQKVLRGEVKAPLMQFELTSRIRVWSTAFSPDGQRLASAGGKSADEKGEVKVWDLSSRHEVLTVGDFSDSVVRVQFSPDGRRLATAGVGLVQLWDAQTGQQQLTLSRRNTRHTAVVFSPDGRRLAAVGGKLAMHPDEEVKVWDTHTGLELMSLRGHVGGLRAVAYSPDGRRLASAGLDQTVKLWDTVTGQPVLTLRGHIDNVFCLDFSPDGSQLASGSVDGTVRIWDASPPEREPEYLTLREHTGAVTDVTFHPDGRSLVSAGTDGKVLLWDALRGTVLDTFDVPPSAHGTTVAYSPDGRHLAAASAGNYGRGEPVKVWEVATKKEICSFPNHTRPVMCVAFSPDGAHIASAGYDYNLRVWDATTAQEVAACQEHNWPIFGVAFSPDGRHLATGSGDTTVRIWDWTTKEKLPALHPPHVSRVVGVAFSRDGKLLATASLDRTVKVWDTASWGLLHDLPHPSGALCVAFDRDGPRLAWGSTDGTVTVWDGPDRETHVLRGHTSWVQAVAFSPDGQWIASGSLDKTIKIWQAPTAPEMPDVGRFSKPSHEIE